MSIRDTSEIFSSVLIKAKDNQLFQLTLNTVNESLCIRSLSSLQTYYAFVFVSVPLYGTLRNVDTGLISHAQQNALLKRHILTYLLGRPAV